MAGNLRHEASYRWINVWLITGGLLSLLLLFNSIRDYRFVSRLLATQQVRHVMRQHVALFEDKLRRSWKPGSPRLNLLLEEMQQAGEQPSWIQIHTGDGVTTERFGSAPERTFTAKEEAQGFKSREAVFKVIPMGKGEVVVEEYAMRGGPSGPPPGSTPGPQAGAPSGPQGGQQSGLTTAQSTASAPAPSGGASTPQVASLGQPNAQGPGQSNPPGGPPGFNNHGLIVVELAMPLVDADASMLVPQRWNLFVGCAGALALLGTVIITGLSVRSFIRGKMLEQQVEFAREVQTRLLPTETQSRGSLRVVTEYQPAEQVSGDFYDLFDAANGRVAIVVGDVSGKGVPAALLMGVLHGAVRLSNWTESAEQHELETQRINQLLCERASGERYATMFWCYYDAANQQIHYINAGHAEPLLVTGSEGEPSVSALNEGSPVIGMLPGIPFRQAVKDVALGDTLVMFSDGLAEATNDQGEEFGEERLRALLLDLAGQKPEPIRQRILAAVHAFLGDAKPQDDLTLVVAQFGKPADGEFAGRDLVAVPAHSA